MQSITECQKFKLRKAGIHQNIIITHTPTATDTNHQNVEEKYDLVEKRIFAIVILALCVLVIFYRYDT